MSFQVRCTTGKFETTWLNVKTVREGFRRPARFEADGPYSKIRWKRK